MPEKPFPRTESDTRSAYRILAHLLAIGVVVQAATLAFGIFGVWNDVDAGLVIDDSYEWNAGMMLHGSIGMLVMPPVALLLLITSFFAKVRRGITWALMLLGTVVLQIVLALVGFGIPAVGALHGINAIVILALAVVAGAVLDRRPSPRLMSPTSLGSETETGTAAPLLVRRRRLRPGFRDVPMYVVDEDDVVRMTISNSSGETHPMPLHGHHVVVLSRNGVEASGSPWWVDSLDVDNGDTYEVAFVADNAGVWMDHCHNLPHAEQGMVAHLAYSGVTSPFLVGGEGRNAPE